MTVSDETVKAHVSAGHGDGRRPSGASHLPSSSAKLKRGEPQSSLPPPGVGGTDAGALPGSLGLPVG
jgi:hypothetical protein